MEKQLNKIIAESMMYKLLCLNFGMKPEEVNDTVGGYGENFALREVVNQAVDREGNSNQFSLSIACQFGVAIQTFFVDGSYRTER